MNTFMGIRPQMGLILGLAFCFSGCSKLSELFPKRINLKNTVPPGYRAMPLPISPWQAQLISPGDRVDVIIVLPKNHPAQPKEHSGQTLIQNGLVIDVRAPLRQGDPSTVVLASNPNEAQWLALAIEEGKLHITVRSSMDSESQPMEIIGFRKLFRN